MKTIPSLVASSTVGVAATGLVFGQPHNQDRPTSNKRKATEYDAQHIPFISPSRPATSSHPRTPIQEQSFGPSPFYATVKGDYFSRLPAQAHSQASTPPGHGRRVGSTGKTGDIMEHMPEERHSISSKSSWMRRLSYIGTSQHGSPRSSVGPDSPSITFSHGSAAPMLHNGFVVHQEPNKLVKRTSTVRGPTGYAHSRESSNARMPTLRRPATSHQRSITLQQQFQGAETSQPGTPIEDDTEYPVMQEFAPTTRRSLWRPYFESAPTRVAKERHTSSSAEMGAEGFYSTSKRIPPPTGALPTLMKPSMIDNNVKQVSKSGTRTRSSTVGEQSTKRHMPHHRQQEVVEEEPEQKTKQSISLHFSSATTWMNKAGSLRIKKGREPGTESIRRAATIPLSSPPPKRAATSHGGSEDINGRAVSQQHNGIDIGVRHGNHTEPATPNSQKGTPILHPNTRVSSVDAHYARNSSSPSNYLNNNGAGPELSVRDGQRICPTALDGRNRALSSHPVVIHQNQPPKPLEINNSDQGSTLVGSETDLKGFSSVEDEEIDFQSDTAYDSYRTGATGSLRARSTPLDSMFDESPPSSGSRSKIADFNETQLFPVFHNHGDSIVEEDEDMATPIKGRRRFDEDNHKTPTREIIALEGETLSSSPPDSPSGQNNVGRLSSGDDNNEDEDEDWTKDDDDFALTNSLSPSSNPTVSLGAGKALRAALGGKHDFGSFNNDTAGDSGPRSNVFDWSESYMHEKLDVMGNAPRPGTVHGKHGKDMRGGRALGRSRPTALHVRSHSVPAVPDINGQRDPKLAPKFGTWGLGAKGVSEDWDNDFEFDGDEESGQVRLNGASAMVVPPAIQASQASVVGHVGQIREVCLLVEDLRRLRGLAREKGIIDGPSADKWREAEGIIALAIPDEEDETLSTGTTAPSSIHSLSRGGHRSAMSIDSFNTHDTATHEYKEYQDNLDDNSQRGTPGTRRQSILTLEDDIFGGSGVLRLSADNSSHYKQNRRQVSAKDNAEIARSIMQNMHQHRATSDPAIAHVISGATSKMPFDTTSLRDLVQRANALTRALSEIIRKADGFTHTPHQSPKLDRDASPAFTRVFTDPLASPKNMQRSQSDNSMLSATIESSPTRNLSQRMHMMVV